ncbi:hypothetical protein NIES4102_07980 [Chondrocystis sp. NIES-4102]|nr:hypothetical protein NIES4102_07980 [Chondrocystis sp. NIES-4102]
MKILRYIIRYFIEIRTQPQIKHKRDRAYGNSYWQIYDPASGRLTNLGSETEVRIWLENYFH